MCLSFMEKMNEWFHKESTHHRWFISSYSFIISYLRCEQCPLQQQQLSFPGKYKTFWDTTAELNMKRGKGEIRHHLKADHLLIIVSRRQVCFLNLQIIPQHLFEVYMPDPGLPKVRVQCCWIPREDLGTHAGSCAVQLSGSSGAMLGMRAVSVLQAESQKKDEKRNTSYYLFLRLNFNYS